MDVCALVSAILVNITFFTVATRSQRQCNVPVRLSETVHIGAVANQQRDVGEVSVGACAVKQVGQADGQRVGVVGQQAAQLPRVLLGDSSRQLAAQSTV